MRGALLVEEPMLFGCEFALFQLSTDEEVSDGPEDCLDAPRDAGVVNRARSACASDPALVRCA